MRHGTINSCYFPLIIKDIYNLSFWVVMITTLQHKYGLRKQCGMDLLWNFIFGINPWDKLSFLMFFLSTIFSGLWRIFFHSVLHYHLLHLSKTPTALLGSPTIWSSLCTQFLRAADSFNYLSHQTLELGAS